MTDYQQLLTRLDALTADVPYPIANLANSAALLYEMLPDLNWAGFYLRQGDRLILGPFQGKTACICIPLGKGVCGVAALENRTLTVGDVHRFPGHIACDSASAAELVIPLHGASGDVIGVMDLDSPTLNRFSPADQSGLEMFAALLEKRIDNFP